MAADFRVIYEVRKLLLQRDKRIMIEDKSKKLRLDLISPEMNEALADVLGMGANKYGERDWENGEVSLDEHYASLLRHLHAWHKGIQNDRESGFNHLDHVFCRAGMMVTQVRRDLKK